MKNRITIEKNLPYITNPEPVTLQTAEANKKFMQYILPNKNIKSVRSK